MTASLEDHDSKAMGRDKLNMNIPRAIGSYKQKKEKIKRGQNLSKME